MPKSPTRQQVLLVDDEPNTLEVLMLGLQPLSDKYEFEAVRNAQEALTKLRHKHFDLLVTDYVMPGMNGVELIRQVKEFSPQTQVVMMTAYGSESLQKTLDELEIGGFLSKPFSLAKIREVVQGAVGNTAVSSKTADRGDVNTAVAQLIQQLQTDTNARATLLISHHGIPLYASGQQQNLDMDTISTLIAANFMAANELARLLDHKTLFKSSYHEGPHYDIYAYDLDSQYFLAVIFDGHSKAGMVRYYTSRTVEALLPLLNQLVPIAAPPDFPEMAAGLNASLEQLFASKK
jgi:CheY-like chemotaxis protein